MNPVSIPKVAANEPNLTDTLSIIIPHYRTEQHMKLCLRSLRKYSQSRLEVIVVDNNSNDSSLEYLKGVSWIRLVENPTQSLGSRAHTEALDLGVKEATGEWLCFFHSDTIVLQPGWDAYLIHRIQDAKAVGLSTLDRDVNRFEPFWDRCKRTLYDWRRFLKERLLKAEGDEKILAFCFFLRREILKETGFSFQPYTGDPVYNLYHDKIKGKYPFLLVSRKELEPLLWHTSNVTSILSGMIKKKDLVDKFYKKNALLMGRKEIAEILADDSLDHI